MKKLIILIAITLGSLSVMAWPTNSYLKIGDIKGESQAKAKAKEGYKALARKYKRVQVQEGRESSLEPGYYLDPDGKLLHVTNSRQLEWVSLGTGATSMESARKNMQLGSVSKAREKGSGMATGRRTYEPITIAKELCVDGKVIKGKHKDKKCIHRGHVTVLK
jgi:hypothetical protein